MRPLKVTLNQIPVQKNLLYFLRTAWSSVKFPLFWVKPKQIHKATTPAIFSSLLV